jgi:hypothetical protein
MRGLRVPLRLIVTTLTLSGCASEQFAPTTSVLSETEAVPLARAVLVQFRALSDEQGAPLSARTLSSAVSLPGVAQQSGPRDSITVVETSEQSEPCDRDEGIARLVRRLQFRIDGETTSGRVDGDLALSLVQCTLVTDGNRRFTLTTAPDLTMRAVFMIENGEPVGDTIESRLLGEFTWQHRTGEGQCRVEVDVSMSVATGSMRAKGQFCGVVLDQTL